MPLLGPTMEGRNAAFQALKPQCVALSQAALSHSGAKGNTRAVEDGLERLKATLSKLASKPDSLDSKLADYIFFPLSQTLKQSNRLSIRCLELCLQCLAILVSYGWKAQIQPQLAAQIVILCTLMAERNPKGFSFSESTDELQEAAFDCLGAVFATVGGSTECQAFFRSEANFPQLGQSITVMLEGIYAGRCAEVQVAATNALRAMIDGVADREMCASFLPGIVSKLTKVLTPSTKQRRSHLVLVGCLAILGDLLRRTLDDDNSVEKRSDVKGEMRNGSIDEKWRETAATQLKPALTSIMRLHNHSRDDVKQALAKLCLLLLKHCRRTLATCSSLALETLVMLSVGQPESFAHIQLEMLIGSDTAMAGLLQTTVYDWLQSLPTIMQSADEEAKVAKMRQISTAYGLLADVQLETGVLDRMLAAALRDSVVITLQGPGKRKEAVSAVEPVQSLDLMVLGDAKGSIDFTQPLVKYRAQEGIMSSIDDFAKRISSSTAFAADLARSMRLSTGEQQIANFWLLFTATQTAVQRKDTIDDFLDFGSSNDSEALYKEYLEDLYAFSLSVLAFDSTSDDEPPDPRLQQLALRTLALRAQTAGPDFRGELIDALYPVLHTLATPNEQLQTDSITTLNIFTSACGYASTKDLVVENVDYLTNAVSLKLNALDVSPQAPQVLLMMVRLAGSSVVPYLEDVVESIFAVLESYHGYGLLVELLFRVLGVVAEEGAKAPQLAAVDAGRRIEAAEIGRERWRPTDVGELVELLRDRRVEEEEERRRRNEERAQGTHPKEPWKRIEEVRDSDADDMGDDDREDDAIQQHSDEPPPPPAPKTYALLLKITELTQHFLPSASPSLRGSLLSLIRTTVPALARHENSFLPLINTIWPEVTSRLEDAESHVQATALEIVGCLCEYAGSFMRSRIVQLWPLIIEMWRGIVQEIMGTGGSSAAPGRQRKEHSSNAMVLVGGILTQAIARLQASPADYTNTSVRLMWDALISTITIIVRNVPLPPERFDEALEMLGPTIEREDVRMAVEAENADAVWLAMVRSAAIVAPTLPTVPEPMSWRFAAVPG